MTEQEFNDVLLKHREESASLLQFAPCIEHLIDDAYCDNLSKLLSLEGSHWEKKKAVSGLGPSLPDSPGLYMFAWHPNLRLKFVSAQTISFRWVIYIGRAGGPEVEGTIRNRYINEYSKYVGGDASQLWEAHEISKREQKLARYLSLCPLEFWFLTLDNVHEIERLERKLIRLLRPPLNIQHGAKLRAGKPIPVV